METPKTLLDARLKKMIEEGVNFVPLEEMQKEPEYQMMLELMEDYGVDKYKQGFTDACNDIAGRIKTVAEQDPLV